MKQFLITLGAQVDCLKQEALRREMLEACEEGSAGWKPEGRDALEFFSVIAASSKKVLVVWGPG